MANEKDTGKELGRKKDTWDKWDVVLRPVGGLLAALSIALVGFFGSQYLEGQQATETNIRLYAELMSNREKADSDLRKEMFNAIIKAFLESKSSENKPEDKKEVLALELIAYNFHDVIDLGPLFKHVEENIQNNPEDERIILQKRLEKVASEVVDKQIGALEDVGVVQDMTVFFEALENNPEGIQLLGETLQLPSADMGSSGPNRLFIVEVLDYDPNKKELRVRLEIWMEDQVEADFTFRVGFFDFPMIDNTRLSKGQRVAIVLRRWESGSAELALVYFPGSRASLKEKPYYDEVVHELVRTRKMLSKPQ
jgi:hypothetical protein